ncbi:serine/arginine repetitive matrix protein 1 [Planoprotostelium fungivorum]|uniref:Serine/arginine repetitive matrix protein 1 n=1 Tax=Planoprotostelium fungivorum TaxID=1890364 RepID=A0A2P6MPB3_9EUKA|nr:serine/arginine repetitive matrix protein 1 [Planoprotostelium fungivorum]
MEDEWSEPFHLRWDEDKRGADLKPICAIVFERNSPWKGHIELKSENIVSPLPDFRGCESFYICLGKGPTFTRSSWRAMMQTLQGSRPETERAVYMSTPTNQDNIIIVTPPSFQDGVFQTEDRVKVYYTTKSHLERLAHRQSNRSTTHPPSTSSKPSTSSSNPSAKTQPTPPQPTSTSRSTSREINRNAHPSSRDPNPQNPDPRPQDPRLPDPRGHSHDPRPPPPLGPPAPTQIRSSLAQETRPPVVQDKRSTDPPPPPLQRKVSLSHIPLSPPPMDPRRPSQDPAPSSMPSKSSVQDPRQQIHEARSLTPSSRPLPPLDTRTTSSQGTTRDTRGPTQDPRTTSSRLPPHSDPRQQTHEARSVQENRSPPPMSPPRFGGKMDKTISSPMSPPYSPSHSRQSPSINSPSWKENPTKIRSNPREEDRLGDGGEVPQAKRHKSSDSPVDTESRRDKRGEWLVVDRHLTLPVIPPLVITMETVHLLSSYYDDWLLGALLEFVHFSHDAQSSRCNIFARPSTQNNQQNNIYITDDGHGMDRDATRKMLHPDPTVSLAERPNLGANVVGGAMALTFDLLVVTKTNTLLTIGLFSKRLNEKRDKKENLKIPLVTWDLSKSTVIAWVDRIRRFQTDPTSPANEADADNMVRDIGKFAELSGMDKVQLLEWAKKYFKTTGNMFILTRVRDDIDTKTDVRDMLLKPHGGKQPLRTTAATDVDFSLKACLSLMFLEPKMTILVQGDEVKCLNLKTTMEKPKAYKFSSTCDLTLGIVPKFRDQNRSGLMLYWKNILVQPFFPISAEGQPGLIGLADVSNLIPTPSKLEFQHNETYRETSDWLQRKVEEYKNWQLSETIEEMKREKLELLKSRNIPEESDPLLQRAKIVRTNSEKRMSLEGKVKGKVMRGSSLENVAKSPPAKVAEASPKTTKPKSPGNFGGNSLTTGEVKRPRGRPRKTPVEIKENFNKILNSGASSTTPIVALKPSTTVMASKPTTTSQVGRPPSTTSQVGKTPSVPTTMTPMISSTVPSTIIPQKVQEPDDDDDDGGGMMPDIDDFDMDIDDVPDVPPNTAPKPPPVTPIPPTQPRMPISTQPPTQPTVTQAPSTQPSPIWTSPVSHNFGSISLSSYPNKNVPSPKMTSPKSSSSISSPMISSSSLSSSPSPSGIVFGIRNNPMQFNPASMSSPPPLVEEGSPLTFGKKRTRNEEEKTGN